MFSRLDIFELGLSAPTWSRILSELVASGLLAGAIPKPRDLDDRMRSLNINNPANLLLAAGDFATNEPFDTPAIPAVPPAAGRGRGRGRGAGAAGAPAVPAVPGPALHACCS
jgi:hypothetical protein